MGKDGAGQAARGVSLVGVIGLGVLLVGAVVVLTQYLGQSSGRQCPEVASIQSAQQPERAACSARWTALQGCRGDHGEGAPACRPQRAEWLGCKRRLERMDQDVADALARCHSGP